MSDVDEIIAANVLKRAVKERRRGDLTVFTMPLYAYFVNRRCPGPDWTLGPRMAERRHVVDGQRMRMTKLHASRSMAGTLPGAIHTRLWNWVNCGVPGRVVQVPDAGWHLSSIGTWHAFREKVAAYSHFERMEGGMYRSEVEFIAQVNALTREVNEAELPQFIREHTNLFERLPDHQPA